LESGYRLCSYYKHLLSSWPNAETKPPLTAKRKRHGQLECRQDNTISCTKQVYVSSLMTRWTSSFGWTTIYFCNEHFAAVPCLYGPTTRFNGAPAYLVSHYTCDVENFYNGVVPFPLTPALQPNVSTTSCFRFECKNSHAALTNLWIFR